MFLRIIGFVVLFCLSFSSSGEAKRLLSPLHVSATKAAKPIPRKKRDLAVVQKRPQRASKIRARSQRVSLSRKKQPRLITARARARTRQAAAAKIRTRQTAAARKRTRQLTAARAKTRQAARAQAKRRITAQKSRPPIVPPPLTHLSSLKPFTQNNAKLGGLDKLYSKNLLGQGQTVAFIELAGTWEEMKNVINNKVGTLSHETRERYKRNFLAPCGGPGLGPEVVTKGMSTPQPTHGPRVASIVLDLSPYTQIFPVSTYDCPQTGFYDTGDALMDLSKRNKVSVINISSGELESKIETLKDGFNTDGTEKYLFRHTFPQRHLNAFKAIAKAGKVVVYAAGNRGEEVRGPEFREKITPSYHERFTGYLLENLDEETKKHIIFAGAYDSGTRKTSGYSNRPGHRKDAQERFLCAPGKNETSYIPGGIDDGTSNAGPYIAAVIANLCSKPGVTPKRAVEALLKTADLRPEKAIYGRGLVRADKALEWLEAGH